MPKGDWKEFADLPVPEGATSLSGASELERIQARDFRSFISRVDEVRSIPQVNDGGGMLLKCLGCPDYFRLTEVGYRDYFGFCSAECKRRYENGV